VSFWSLYPPEFVELQDDIEYHREVSLATNSSFYNILASLSRSLCSLASYDPRGERGSIVFPYLHSVDSNTFGHLPWGFDFVTNHRLPCVSASVLPNAVALSCHHNRDCPGKGGPPT